MLPSFGEASEIPPKKSRQWIGRSLSVFDSLASLGCLGPLSQGSNLLSWVTEGLLRFSLEVQPSSGTLVLGSSAQPLQLVYRCKDKEVKCTEFQSTPRDQVHTHTEELVFYGVVSKSLVDLWAAKTFQKGVAFVVMKMTGIRPKVVWKSSKDPWASCVSIRHPQCSGS